MVQGRVGGADIGAGEGEVPELSLAGPGIGKAGLKAAVRDELDVVGAAFRSGGEILDDAVGE